MIVGISKRSLLALPRAIRRVVREEPLVTPRAPRPKSPRLGSLAAFAQMMERQAALIIGQLGE